MADKNITNFINKYSIEIIKGEAKDFIPNLKERFFDEKKKWWCPTKFCLIGEDEASPHQIEEPKLVENFKLVEEPKIIEKYKLFEEFKVIETNETCCKWSSWIKTYRE